MTLRTNDIICPLLSYGKQPCASALSSPILSFSLDDDFPGWSAEWLRTPELLAALPLAAVQDFWQQPALSAYLAASPQGVEHTVLCLQHSRYPTLYLAVQTFTFQSREQIRQSPNKEVVRWGFRKWLSSLFSFKVLALGQFMVSGAHALGGAEELDFDPLPLFHAAALAITRQQKGYWGILMKDLMLADSSASSKVLEMGYYPLPVDPSMQVHIQNRWRDFSDYLLDISSKYRVRYKRARKQLGGLTKRELTLADSERYQGELHQLYLNIKAEASFDAIALSPDYFSALKSLFPGEVRFFAYFLDEEMVGFYTTISNGSTLHAHYLGFDKRVNEQQHLYHNMLFDMLEEAISGKYEVLDLGRTALEIKSSIGAEPVVYSCGLYGLSPIVRLAIKYFTPALFKASEWQPRNPFKE